MYFYISTALTGDTDEGVCYYTCIIIACVL